MDAKTCQKFYLNMKTHWIVGPLEKYAPKFGGKIRKKFLTNVS